MVGSGSANPALPREHKYMMELPLTNGYVAKVDDRDYAWLRRYKWYANDSQDGDIYARARIPELGKQVYLHRFITLAQRGEEVDHINLNTLDNQRRNLRRCRRAQNNHNRPVSTFNAVGLKGVNWKTRENKWRAYICPEGSFVSLGLHETKEDAAYAYDQAAYQLYGEFARLNIPF